MHSGPQSLGTVVNRDRLVTQIVIAAKDRDVSICFKILPILPTLNVRELLLLCFVIYPQSVQVYIAGLCSFHSPDDSRG